MNSAAVITLLIVASFIWGGLSLIVVTAMRREAAKAGASAPGSATSTPSDRATES